MKNILRHKENNPIYNGLKNYCGVNPTKESKGLHNENLKHRRKKLTKTLDGKTSHAHGLIEITL